jgi:hypothetical protein
VVYREKSFIAVADRFVFITVVPAVAAGRAVLTTLRSIRNLSLVPIS